MSEEKKWLASDEKTELRPFDRVLVRDGDDGIWTPQFLSCCVDNGIHYYAMDGNTYEQCIPYRGNESLVDTVASIPEPRQDAQQPDKPLEWGERVWVWMNGTLTYKGIYVGMEEDSGKYCVILEGGKTMSVWEHCKRLWVAPQN